MGEAKRGEEKGMIAVGTKLHPEARRKLRVAAAERGHSTAEILRAVVYGAFGLEHLPVVTKGGAGKG